MLLEKLSLSFLRYLVEIVPAVFVGFILSGIIHEFVPDEWIEKHLGGRGMKGVFWSTLAGTLAPVCCWGALPIAVSFRRKGASLGPILAVLIVTPATSINALVVTAGILGIKFAAFLFFSVILMGITAGFIGNRINVKGNGTVAAAACGCGEKKCRHCEAKAKKDMRSRIKSILKYAFVDMPRDIGKELLFGICLAAIIESLMPVGYLVKNYLKGAAGYAFALIFGLSVYFCATMGVPVVDALIRQGLSKGAGFTLLLAGPITSYGTILVLRKEFGMRILMIYLAFICAASLLAGYIFSLI
jgi:hypothetical protein